MSNYTVKNLKEIDNAAEQFGIEGMEARFGRKPLELEKFGFSYQTLDAELPSAVRSYSTRRRRRPTSSCSGSGRIKVEDEIVDLKEWDAIRVARPAGRGSSSRDADGDGLPRASARPRADDAEMSRRAGGPAIQFERCGATSADANPSPISTVPPNQRSTRAITGVSAQPVGDRARDDGVEAVAHQAEAGEREAEQHDLQPDVAGADVDELRDEREDEDDRLRVQQIDDEPLRVEVAARPRRAALDAVVGLPREQPADAEEDQIRGADVPDRVERDAATRARATRGRPSRA